MQVDPAPQSPAVEGTPSAATTTDEGPFRYGAWLLLLLSFATAIVVPIFFGDAPQDDAYIAWIYSRNFARGEGFVFNAGEPPLEGYVNFLWTAAIGCGMRLGMDPEKVVPWAGLLLTLLTVGGTWVLSRRLGATPWFAGLAALLFATRPTLAVHAMGGMEPPLFGLLVLLGLLPRLREGGGRGADWRSSALLGLATMTRPEAVLIYGALELAELVPVVRDRAALLAAVRRAAIRAIPYVLIVGSHALWRHATYGAWIPHVFHAKVAASPEVWAHGVDYLFRGLLYFGPLFVLLPYFVRPADAFRTARNRCLWLTSVYLFYPLYVGGDYIPTFRFLWPLTVVWSALVAASVSTLVKVGGGLRTGAASFLFVTLLLFHTAFEHAHGYKWQGMHERHAQLVAAGKKLDEILPEDAWIAATNVGRVPYFADRRTLDMMGLNDEHIGKSEMVASPTLAGHLKGDGKYVLDRAPEVITFLRLVVYEAALAKQNWRPLAWRSLFGVSESEIMRDPRFHEEYRMYSVELADVGCWLNVFARAGVFSDDMPAGMIAEQR